VTCSSTANPYIPFNVDEQEIVIAYLARIKHKFNLPI
jgi:hypothetical protein